MAVPICLRLLVQLIWQAFFLAAASAGKSIAARIAMMAMTTSSSMSVKARIVRRNIFGFECSMKNLLPGTVKAGAAFGCKNISERQRAARVQQIRQRLPRGQIRGALDPHALARRAVHGEIDAAIHLPGDGLKR